MCWICDHPEATHEDYLNQLRATIDDFGWAVQGVERDRIHPPWAYTPGLTACGRPELVVTGMPVRRAARVFNDVAAHVLHAEPPRPGEQVRLTGGPLIEIVRVAEPAAHLLTAASLYGPKIRALQVVHADDAGQWPWDRQYRGRPRRTAGTGPPRAAAGGTEAISLRSPAASTPPPHCLHVPCRWFSEPEQSAPKVRVPSASKGAVR